MGKVIKKRSTQRLAIKPEKSMQKSSTKSLQNTCTAQTVSNQSQSASNGTRCVQLPREFEQKNSKHFIIEIPTETEVRPSEISKVINRAFSRKKCLVLLPTNKCQSVEGKDTGSPKITKGFNDFSNLHQKFNLSAKNDHILDSGNSSPELVSLTECGRAVRVKLPQKSGGKISEILVEIPEPNQRTKFEGIPKDENKNDLPSFSSCLERDRVLSSTDNSDTNNPYIDHNYSEPLGLTSNLNLLNEEKDSDRIEDDDWRNLYRFCLEGTSTVQKAFGLKLDGRPN